MAKVSLVGGATALVDDEDLDHVLTYRWYLLNVPESSRCYALTYLYGEDGRRTSLFLHRLVMNAAPDKRVDHWDCDGLNCQKHNLRLATPAQNSRNSRIARHNTSGYKGVAFHREARRWRAYIITAGKYNHLGFHNTPEQAAHAYDDRARELFGEFARLNFPQPGEQGCR